MDVQAGAPQLQHVVAALIGSIPEVEAVLTGREDSLMRVWTVVSDASREVRRKVYGKEREVIDSHEPFDFEFRVFSSRGRDARSFLAETMTLSYQRSH